MKKLKNIIEKDQKTIKCYYPQSFKEFMTLSKKVWDETEKRREWKKKVLNSR